MILDKIVAHKKLEISRKKVICTQDELLHRIKNSCTPRASFRQALAKEGISLIAEIKKASPSKGILREDFDPVKIAGCYEVNGASAISVITDEEFFLGRLEYLEAVKVKSILPVLRKDFHIDPYQLYEARAYGADAVLLIASILDGQELQTLLELSAELGMDALVEVHTEEELNKALKCQAKIIGINNRNLQTFKTELQTTFELAKKVPADCILVSESGISESSHIEHLKRAGINAVLVGEALMVSEDMAGKVRELSGR